MYARDMSSIFSRIVAGEIPCHKVWEDDRHFAFLDIAPIGPGHTLVIPKEETDYLFDLEGEAYRGLWDAAHTVARRMRSVLDCRRVCVMVEGYEVPHVHVHLIPTDQGPDFRGSRMATDHEALAAMAAKLAF